MTDYWNGACVEGEKCTIAIKANGPIADCTWYGPKGEYSSEDNDKEVKIEESDYLCKLTIDKSDKNDHDGLWEVTLYGKTNDRKDRNDRDRDRERDRGKKRKKRQIVLLPGQTPVQNPLAGQIGITRRRGMPSSLLTRDRQTSVRNRASNRSS